MEKGKRAIAVVVFFITVMLVALISIQFKSVDETYSIGIEKMQEDELRKELADWKNKYQEVNGSLEVNNQKIADYMNTTKNNVQASKLLDSELNEYNMLIGKTNVVGNGVVIKLTDTYEYMYTAGNLVYILNELRYAGAEAISINNQRVVNNTDIVSIQGRYIMVNSEKINAPYEIKVIGDKDKLEKSLNSSKDGLINEYSSKGYDIKLYAQDNITIPAYSKNIELKYIKEAQE